MVLMRIELFCCACSGLSGGWRLGALSAAATAPVMRAVRVLTLDGDLLWIREYHDILTIDLYASGKVFGSNRPYPERLVANSTVLQEDPP